MLAGRILALWRAPSVRVSVAFALMLILLPGTTLSAGALTRSATDASSVILSVAANQTVNAPGQDVAIALELTNMATDSVATGAVTLSVRTDRLDSPAAVGAWASGSQSDSTQTVVTQGTSLPIPASGTTSTTLTAPAASFAGEGVWGVEASWTAGGLNRIARTAIVVSAAPAQAEVSVIATITPGNVGSGILSAKQLSELTAQDGVLTRQLDALSGTAVTVGIDPRILVSIRALGTQAPASATAWLAKLQSAGFDTFALHYGDADASLQAQLGMNPLMTPGTFDDLGVDAAALPSLASFPYSRTLLWPLANSVNQQSLDVFAASTKAPVVLDSTNVGVGAGASAAIANTAVVTAQSEASGALGQAFSAKSAAAAMNAINVMQSALSFAGNQRVVVTTNRSIASSASRGAQALGALANSPVSRISPLATLAIPGGTATQLVERQESAERLSTGRHILDRQASVAQFSEVATTPAELTAPVQRDVLALLGAGWATTPSDWTAAIGGFDAQIATMLSAVQVVSSSTINVLASEASLPFTVENGLDVAVNVRLSVAPSNGRLVVGEPVETEIAPNARVTVRIPVEARISNGSVTLLVQLSTIDGTPVGAPTVIPANVQADWEGLSAGIIALFAAGLFGFGIWRQVRKIRRERVKAADE